MRLGSRKALFAGVMLLVSTLTFLVTGCGSTSSSGKAAASNQLFKLGFGVPEKTNDFETLDPQLIEFGTDYATAQLIFPPLLTLDANSKPEAWAATALPTVSSDGLTYTFKVRPGLKWSDGTAIDANTYAYSINRAIDPCTASPVNGYLADALAGGDDFTNETCTNGKITGSTTTLIGTAITAPDAQTLVLKLAQPAGYFNQVMTYPTAWAAPKQLIDQYQDKWTDHLADNGGFGGNLFKVTKWDHQGHLTLARNDAFWGTKPKLSEIDYTLYYDPQTEVNDYKSGVTDSAQDNIPANYPNDKSQPGFHQVPIVAYNYLELNWHMAPFDDVRMRQAIALSINKQALADKVNYGSTLPTNHIVIKGLPQYNANLTGPDGTQSLTGNAAQAKKLAQAYAADKCGGDLTKCEPITLTIRSGSQPAANSAAAIQQFIQDAIGLRININPIERKQQVKLARSHQLQFTTNGWIADYPDAQDFMSLFFLPKAQENDGFWDVPEADKLMQDADVSSDQNLRTKNYQQAEQLLVNAVPVIPTSQSQEIYFTKDYVVGYDYDGADVVALDTWAKVYIAQH